MFLEIQKAYLFSLLSVLLLTGCIQPPDESAIEIFSEDKNVNKVLRSKNPEPASVGNWNGATQTRAASLYANFLPATFSNVTQQRLRLYSDGVCGSFYTDYFISIDEEEKLISFGSSGTYSYDIEVYFNGGDIQTTECSPALVVDRLVPLAPTMNSLGGSTLNDRNIPVVITAAATDSGGSGLSHHQVSICNSAGGSCFDPANCVIQNGPVTTGTITVAVPGDGTYFACVRGVDGVGNEGNEASSSFFDVDTMGPVVESFGTLPNGHHKAANSVYFELNFNENITVYNTPRIKLNVGGEVRYADFNSSDGAKKASFRYVVGGTDNDSDGLEIVSLELNGGQIKDIHDNAYVSALLPSIDTSDIIIDTTEPSLTLSSGSGAVANLDNHNSFSVSGTCEQSTQNIFFKGSTDSWISSIALGSMPCGGDGSFSTNLDLAALGDSTNLQLKVYQSDLAGNTGFSNIVTIVKDIVPPSYVDVTPSPPVAINLSNQQAYSFGGTCAENDQTVYYSIAGSIAGQATCSAGTWSSSVEDLRTIGDGQNIAFDITHKDAAGNSVDFSTSALKDTVKPNVSIIPHDGVSAGTCSGYPAQHTTVSNFPIYFKVIFDSEINDSTFGLGDLAEHGTVNSTTRTLVNCNDNKVFLIQIDALSDFGTISLQYLQDKAEDNAGNSNTASIVSDSVEYTNASAATHLTFDNLHSGIQGDTLSAFQVNMRDASELVDIDGVDSIALGAFTDSNCSSAIGGFLSGTTSVAAVSGVANFSDVQVNSQFGGVYFKATASPSGFEVCSPVFGVAPGIASKMFPAGPETFMIGESVDLSITYQQAVNVTGNPRIPLTLDSGTVYANYLSGSGSSTLTFRYNVQEGDFHTTTIISAANSIDLNGGTIKHEGYNAELDITGLSTSTLKVDGIKPTLTSVSISSSYDNTAFAGLGNSAKHVFVSFAASEDLSGLPSVHIAGRTAIVAGPDGGVYTASQEMSGTDDEGNITFSINFSDLNGNLGDEVGLVTDGSTVFFDKTAPALAATNPQWDHANPYNGTIITAKWIPSIDPDVLRQRVYFYDNGTCTGDALDSNGFGAADGSVNDNTTAQDSHDNTPELVSGTTYSFRVRAYDRAGNFITSDCSVGLYLDWDAPAMVSFDVPDGAIHKGQVDVNLSGGTDNSGSSAYYYTVNGTEPTCSSDTGTKITVTPPGDNLNTILKAVACDDAGNISDVAAIELHNVIPKIEPYYTNAPNWGDWVADAANRESSACNAGVDFNCFHGGSMRMVDLPNVFTCDGLALTDIQGFYDWHCDDNGGAGPTRFVGSLADGKSLKNLLTIAPNWKNSKVTIAGTHVLDTVDSAGDTSLGYNNALSGLPGSSATVATLSTPGTIYTFNANSAPILLKGIKILANKISIVGLGNFALKKSDTLSAGDKFCYAEGGLTGATASHCFIGSSDKNFLYVDGIFDGLVTGGGKVHDVMSLKNVRYSIFSGTYKEASQRGIYLISSFGNELKNLKVRNVEGAVDVGDGLVLDNSVGNLLSDIKLTNNESRGLLLTNNSNENKLYKIKAAHNKRFGVHLQNSHRNGILNLQASNTYKAHATEGYGVYLDGATDNILSSVLSVHNYAGFRFGSGANNNILMNSTIGNNSMTGIYVGNSHNNSIYSTVTWYNGGGANLHLSLAGNNRIRDFFSSHGAQNVRIDSTANIFQGDLSVGYFFDGNSTKSCWTDLNTGLVTDSCANNGSSTAILDRDNVRNLELGIVTLKETDVNGTKLTSNLLTNWIDDDANHFTTYGKINTASAGSCEGSECVKWDWRLVSGEYLINKSRPNPSLAATYTHTWAGGGSVDFYLNAREYVQIKNGMTNRGNQNILCEAHEDCLIQKNHGAYQGGGTIIRDETSDFDSDADATNDVLFWKYPSNGVVVP